ncbi:hypothetical protein UPYG_G00280290 [Umbra pygmaea]|uniref:Fibronectin type-III domain-containing protein n=1 Tax=Umbra pygmaea TaxID=75934 RepID=A0ABD0W7C5_UMBPY
MHFPRSMAYFIFALLSSLTVSEEDCLCKRNSSCLGHDVTSQENLMELDCFVKIKGPILKCVWKPGKPAVNKTQSFTLIIQQRTLCKSYENISGTQHEIPVIRRYNITACLFDENDPKSCTKTVFRGSPSKLVRCGPPVNVHFTRHSRQLNIRAYWGDEENYFKNYIVRYKELNTSSRNKTLVQSQNKHSCTVGNLSSLLNYEVQIKVMDSPKCTQCPWSMGYLVQPELVDKPVVKMVKDTPRINGSRFVIIKWEFAAREFADGYNVKVGKPGEEHIQSFNTTRLVLRLTLSHAAYHFNITAVNSAGTSPAAQRTILPLDDKGLYGKINVTFNSNTSFNVSWLDDLIQTYTCFSVEWWRKAETAHRSFYEDNNNYEVIKLDEPLKRYTRYTFTLHTRLYKDTCNLKSINNSESTYGSIQAYFIEGSPVSAPGNISRSNVTQSSMVLKWTPVSEDDMRGFLLGYVLHYREHTKEKTDNETSINLDAGSTSYKLADLKSSTVYQIQLSAVTAAGMGVRSSTLFFDTNPEASQTLIAVTAAVVGGAALLFFFGHLGFKLFKRAKTKLWPSIPNPGYSNAIQKIDGGCKQGLLEPTDRENLEEEEGDSKSLHVVDRKQVPSVDNLYNNCDQEDNQEPCTGISTTDAAKPNTVDPQTNISLCQRDATADGKASNVPADGITPTSTDKGQTASVPNSIVAQHCPQVAFPGDYTTMESFQQTMQHCVPAMSSPLENHGQSSQLTDTDSLMTRPGLDYICQSLCNTFFYPSQSTTSQTQDDEMYSTAL